ncbi:MAG: PEP-CTERM sorting domain-containing protein [Planctomycetia bacterium]
MTTRSTMAWVLRRGRRSVARIGAVGAVIAVGLMATDAVAISTSSLDTFATTNEGWKIGSNGVQPTQVSGTGPDGQIGYLSHFSDGGGSNGKWLMWNDETTWQGNYTAAGVTGISLAANVTSGGSPVSMRIAFDGSGGWFSSTPVSVGGGWNTYLFSLTPANFTHVAAGGGTGTFADTMAAVTRFEVFSGDGAVDYRGNGDVVQAGVSTNTILIDNIAAVPEPAALALMAAASVAIGFVGRRCRS